MVEILVLQWTNTHGMKKGEIVLTPEGLWIYKTAKRVLLNADSFRDLIYAELPWSDIESITCFDRMLNNRFIRIKISKPAFDKILHTHHGFFTKHLTNLFNRGRIVQFETLHNSGEELEFFVKEADKFRKNTSILTKKPKLSSSTKKTPKKTSKKSSKTSKKVKK